MDQNNQPMNPTQPTPSSPSPMAGQAAPSMPTMPAHDKKHKMMVWTIFVVVAVVVGVLVLWMAKWVDLGFESPSIKTSNDLSGEDVVQELDGVQLEDLDAQFIDIDGELDGL